MCTAKGYVGISRLEADSVGRGKGAARQVAGGGGGGGGARGGLTDSGKMNKTLFVCNENRVGFALIFCFLCGLSCVASLRRTK